MRQIEHQPERQRDILFPVPDTMPKREAIATEGEKGIGMKN